MPTLYIAGPEVFLPDAAEVMGEKRRIAAGFGFAVTGPGPDENANPTTEVRTARGIYLKDRRMMLEAEYCLANITPFRGVSADVGTVFEIGFMIASGRRVWAYSNDPRPYGARVWSEWYRQEGPQAMAGADGLVIETYGLADNLMIDCGIAEHGGQVIRPEGPVADPDRDLAAYTSALELMAASL